MIMSNSYGIPQKDLDLVVKRDKKCVYCHKEMVSPWDPEDRSNSVTIEHLNHRQDWDSVRSYVNEGKPVSSIIAICCGACNSSRSSMSLRKWFDTEYCRNKEIDLNSVDEVVREYILNTEGESR